MMMNDHHNHDNKDDDCMNMNHQNHHDPCLMVTAAKATTTVADEVPKQQHEGCIDDQHQHQQQQQHKTTRKKRKRQRRQKENGISKTSNDNKEEEAVTRSTATTTTAAATTTTTTTTDTTATTAATSDDNHHTDEKITTKSSPPHKIINRRGRYKKLYKRAKMMAMTGTTTTTNPNNGMKNTATTTTTTTNHCNSGVQQLTPTTTSGIHVLSDWLELVHLHQQQQEQELEQQQQQSKKQPSRQRQRQLPGIQIRQVVVPPVATSISAAAPIPILPLSSPPTTKTTAVATLVMPTTTTTPTVPEDAPFHGHILRQFLQVIQRKQQQFPAVSKPTTNNNNNTHQQNEEGGGGGEYPTMNWTPPPAGAKRSRGSGGDTIQQQQQLVIHNCMAISHIVIIEINVNTQQEAEQFVQSLSNHNDKEEADKDANQPSWNTSSTNNNHSNNNTVNTAVVPTVWFHPNQSEPQSMTNALMYHRPTKNCTTDTSIRSSTAATTTTTTMDDIIHQLEPYILSVQQLENENYPLLRHHLQQLPQQLQSFQPSTLAATATTTRTAITKHDDTSREVEVEEEEQHQSVLSTTSSINSITTMELEDAQAFIQSHQIPLDILNSDTNLYNSNQNCNATTNDIIGDILANPKRQENLLPFVGHPIVTTTTTTTAATTAAAIVHSNTNPSQQLCPAPPRRRIFCIDCEMVETNMGKELARVTIGEMISVHSNNDQQQPAIAATTTRSTIVKDGCSMMDVETYIHYDAIVQPYNHITNYLTKYSGISASTYNNCNNSTESGKRKAKKSNDVPVVQTVLRLEQVQSFLLQLVHPNDIVIGHSLENDLHALRFVHLTVIDTAMMFQNQSSINSNNNNATTNANTSRNNVSSLPSSKRSFKYSLRHLAAVLLKKQIQQKVDGPHCSQEDAITALELAVHRAVVGPSFRMNSSMDNNTNWFTKVSQQSKNNSFPLTAVSLGPIVWLQQHILSRHPSNAIHTLQCESVEDSNSKAIVRWLSGPPTRRAGIIWSKMDASSSSADKNNNNLHPSKTIGCLIAWVKDVVSKLSCNNSIVLVIPIQINYTATKRLYKQRQLRRHNPRSTLPWSQAHSDGMEEQQYQTSLDACRNGYVVYVTSKD